MITPISVPQTDLQDKLDEFAATYNFINDSEATVAENEFAAKEWLKVHEFYRVGDNLVDAFDEIKATTPCTECGATKPDALATVTLRKEYEALIVTLVNSRIALQKARNHLGDIKSYVSFLKEVGQLVPPPSKGNPQGQKPQQQEGQ